MSRAAPNHFRKTLNGFQPVSKAAQEFHTKTKLGQVVELKGRRPRNPGHHRKLFALLGVLVDNTEDFSSTEDALTAIKAATGHGRWVKIGRAERELFMPDSIAFDAMGQDDFEAFYSRAIAAVIRFWLPVSDEQLREAVEAFAA
jgi:hypothetical protein